MTSGALLPAIQVSPKNWMVVRPGGSQRGSRPHTTPGHRGALALGTTIGPSTGDVTAPGPAQTPPPNPIAARTGDGRVQSRPSSRVHEPCSSTEVVALRSQTGLTGFGSHRSSYGGFGGGHPHFRPHARRRAGDGARVTGIEPALSAWEVSGAARPPPACWLTCGCADGLSVRDRDCPRGLVRSGT